MLIGENEMASLTFLKGLHENLSGSEIVGDCVLECETRSRCL